MRFPVLNDYLQGLPKAAGEQHRIWLDAEGQVQGSYFNYVLTSVFQPVRQHDTRKVVGYEAFVRSSSESDTALSIWKLLEGAASDDESILLDRLCRMLHAINYFRQAADDKADLFLSVHERLLAAVSSSHGTVFKRILASLGLPVERIVLQMPPARHGQQFPVNYVAGNYRRSGFRVALNAHDVADGLRLVEQIAPHVLRLDARKITDADCLKALAVQCGMRGTRLLLTQVESTSASYLSDCPKSLLVQGDILDPPAPTLEPPGGERKYVGTLGRKPMVVHCVRSRVSVVSDC